MKQIATRLTALLLALVMTTTLALAANKSGYSDVPDKNWASQSIAQCKQYNLLQGIGGGKFGLGQKMTRAAYAAALCLRWDGRRHARKGQLYRQSECEKVVL